LLLYKALMRFGAIFAYSDDLEAFRL